MDIQTKINQYIDTECKYADSRGSSTLSVCDHYLWDRDLWAFRNQIVDAIRSKGYNVSVSVKWGVTDINTTKKININ